jgi:hypothetical protein
VRAKRRVPFSVLLALLLIGAIAFAASDTVRFVVCSAAGAMLYGVPTNKDASDAEQICERIKAVHHFIGDSASKPGEAPLFSTVGSKQLLRNPTVIYVYDIQDSAEQDKVVSALEQLAAAEHIPPFNVCFYDHENWQVSGTSGERGPENQLKCVRVAAGQVRQISGAKVITYAIP